MNRRRGRTRDDSLESMSDPEEDEDDMPEDPKITIKTRRVGVGAGDGDGDEEAEVVPEVVPDGNGETHEDEEEDSSDDFFDAGEGAVIPDRLSLRPASESGQSGSGGGTEDDPVGPVTPALQTPTPKPSDITPN
jgi:hypothetical protein